MADVNCLYEEHELEAARATVELQLFPAVIRKGYDPSGMFWREPTVMVRAQVLAAVAEYDHVPCTKD